MPHLSQAMAKENLFVLRQVKSGYQLRIDYFLVLTLRFPGEGDLGNTQSPTGR